MNPPSFHGSLNRVLDLAANSARDATLIRLIQHGSEDGLRGLLGEIGSQVRSALVHRYAGASAEQIDQAIADAALNMWHHSDRFDPEAGQLSGYFYAIARNGLVSMLRAQACRPLFVQMESEYLEGLTCEADDAGRSGRTQAMLASLRDCIAKLSPQQRDIVLSDLANQSAEPIGRELADRWATSTNAIRVARNRAHRLLSGLMSRAVGEASSDASRQAGGQS